jgi:hypothetical protein
LDIEKIQKQRFAYLLTLYIRSKGDPRVWFYSGEIGKELKFSTEVTDLITQHLKDKQLVKLQTYKETFPKKDSFQSKIGIGILSRFYDTFVVGDVGKAIWPHIFREPIGRVPEYAQNSKTLVDHYSDMKNLHLYPLIRITPQGVTEVEQAFESPTNPTSNFNALIVQFLGDNVSRDKITDSYKNIEAGPGAAVGNEANASSFNNSLLQNSLNSVEKEYGEDVKQSLKEVADFIKKSKNVSADTLFDRFNQELTKPQKDKATLKNLWSNIEQALPAITSIGSAISKITGLFS